MNQQTRIISGFPGIGKSTFAAKHEGDVSDSDSSTFDKSDFPANYMRHIKQQVLMRKWVMVSSHDTVRAANSVLCDLTGNRSWDVPCLAAAMVAFAAEQNKPKGQ